MVKRFRTKVVEIEAMRFIDNNHADLIEWTGGNFREGYNDEFTGEVWDFLHNTWIAVKNGQWIVRGAKGEFYPCDDETFHWKYEEVEVESDWTMHDLRRAYTE